MASNGWFKPGTYKYADTGERFIGIPPTIKIGSIETGTRYFDADKRELLPVGGKAHAASNNITN